jgi:uncharacterized protein with HEPN domain
MGRESMLGHDDSRPMERMLQRARQANALVRDRQRQELDRERILVLALLQLLVMLGNIAEYVSQDGRARWSEIPWDRIIETGNRLIREYDAVDYDAVWRLAVEDLPVLIANLERSLPGHVS